MSAVCVFFSRPISVEHDDIHGLQTITLLYKNNTNKQMNNNNKIRRNKHTHTSRMQSATE